MENFCSFCSTASKHSSVVSLLDLCFIDDGLIIKFPTILSDVLPEALLNLNWICESCYTIVVKFFHLKKQVLDASQRLAKLEESADPVTSDNNCTDLDASNNNIEENKSFASDEQSSKLLTHCSKVDVAVKAETVKDEASDFLVEVQGDLKLDLPPTKRRLRTRAAPVEKDKHKKTEKILTHIKGRTPRLMKPSKTSQVLDILNGNCDDLSLKQKKFVSEQVAKSKVKHDLYNCAICSKMIHSYSGFRYHIVSKHIFKSDPQKAFVAERLEAGHRIIFIKGQKQESWECQICSKVFSSHPAIRYHLNRHVIEGDVNIDS